MDTHTQPDPAPAPSNGARNWLATGFAIFSFGLLGLIALPAVTSAEDEPPDTDSVLAAHNDEIDCEASSAEGEFPRMTEFLAELATDGVVSQEQAEAIDARFREHAEYRCLLHQLFPKREAIGVTADTTDTSRGNLLRALTNGASLAGYAADHGIDEATLVDAIMVKPAERAAERVASGELQQVEANELLAEVEAYATELIQAESLRGIIRTRW